MEEEVRKLKELVADLMLDTVMLQEVLGRHPLGVRRACGLMRLNRVSRYNCPHRCDDIALLRRLHELDQARPRFGYLRLHEILRREGWIVHRKLVHESTGEKREPCGSCLVESG